MLKLHEKEHQTTATTEVRYKSPLANQLPSSRILLTAHLTSKSHNPPLSPPNSQSASLYFYNPI